MPGFRPLVGRRHFLASAMVGAVGLLLPAHGARAATAPPGSGTPTLAPLQPTAVPSEPLIAAAPALPAAAPIEVTGDQRVRPFHYRATDAELSELHRRIRETRWPERETVNDDT